MDLPPQALEAEWKKGKFRPVYYFIGEDSPAKLAALDKLKETFNADPLNFNEFSGDLDSEVAEIVSCCQTPPMLAERRLVIVRNIRGAQGRKDLAAYLDDPLASTILAMASEELKPDPRDPLAGAAQALGGVVVFRALKKPDAEARLREEARKSGFELDLEAAALMTEEAGGAWGILKTELDKLKLFARGKKRITAQDALACLGYRRGANPFELPRSLERRDARGTLKELRLMLEEGDAFQALYRITWAVNRQLKAKRLARSGAAPESIFRELRLNNYYDRDYLRQLEKLSEESLVRGLKSCLETEVALKSRVWLDCALELEGLVLSLCSKNKT